MSARSAPWKKLEARTIAEAVAERSTPTRFLAR